MSECEVPAGDRERDELSAGEMREIRKRQTERVRDPDWQRKREVVSAAIWDVRSSVTPFDGSELFVRGPNGRFQ